MYYPLYIDLQYFQCLIVGAGDVALRKVQSLLNAKVEHVLVLDINPFTLEWQELQAQYASNLSLEQRAFADNDIVHKNLVFAATSNTELNKYIALLCAKSRILCNCIDTPRLGSCIVPATAKSPAYAGKIPLMAAISTAGASPAWSRVLRKELEEWLVPRSPLSLVLGRLRPLLLALKYDTRHNTKVFRALVQSNLRHALVNGQKQECENILCAELPKALHKHIAELLYDVL